MEVSSPKQAAPEDAGSSAAVSARGVIKRFGERTAVADIDFEVEAGI